MKDRRNASQIKNINMLKRMGSGKGNWGTELQAQMMADDSEYIWETDINESETTTTSVAAAEEEEAKSKEVASESITTEAKEDKLEEAEVRKNKKGYVILNIERNFGGRGSLLKEDVADENQDPNKGDEADKKEPDLAAVKKREEALLAKVVKSQEELQKSAALRFKKKGPAWGKAGEGATEKPKKSTIKEELKQKK